MWRPSERWRSGWDGEFESPLLQQRVYCELRRWAMVFVAARQKGHGVVIRMIRQPPDPLMGRHPNRLQPRMCTGRARFHSVEMRAHVVPRQVQQLASELPIFLDLR